MKTNTTLEKYFLNHAENEITSLEGFHHEYLNIVTVPGQDEKFESIQLLLDSIEDNSALLVLIVNSQVNSTAATKQSNLKLIMDIKRDFQETWKSKTNAGISLNKTHTCDLLLIDRSSGSFALPSKTGVGLARKIAADIALQLIMKGNIKSKWIHCTDADAILPNNYFEYTKNLHGCAAAIYPYSHTLSTDNITHKNATLLYELSLRHYVIGLRHARSNYAFHTIGSTIAIDCEAYAKVRGFPIRESGEDFYLLNKLLKVGKIHCVSGEPVIVDGRVSHRVPFGTGRSVEKIALMENMDNDFLFYNPKIFDELKKWIRSIHEITHTTTIKDFISHNIGNSNNLMLLKTLENIGAMAAIETAIKSSDKAHIRQQHLHTWFDGFRTLKFIHQMRDLGFSSIPLKELINAPLYAALNLPKLPTLEDLLNQFKKLESHLTSDNK